MKIAFCKFAGMGNGGIEKYMQSIAMLFKKDQHEVDYYYTNAAPLINHWWVHPDNHEDRIKLLKSYDINLIPVFVEARRGNEWINSNFFEIFNESAYDCLITAGNGESEYPYNRLKNIPIIHTVHGHHPFNQHNIKKSVLLCKWQADRWVANGGDASKLEIIPPIVTVPSKWNNDFRKKHNIPEDAFVYGLHQRNDNSISSDIALRAFASIQKPNTYYVMLGGTEVHKNFVNNNNLKNVIFADYTADVEEIHSFLNAIDVYAHCRVDGEVCSASIIEAMYHGKPVISYPGVNMGHAEQIESCGKMTFSVEEYSAEMVLLQNKEYHLEKSEKTKIKYQSTYDYICVKNKLRELLQ
jgi:glycosyltransferase involved in cell wall biosynthesis